MTVLVASDLDRTLIYSAAALLLGGGAEDTICVERYQDKPQSFSTRRSLELLAAVIRHTDFVPVTTRTPEQYRRVNLSVDPAKTVIPKFAVCSNGGDILVDGAVDADWHRQANALC